MPQDTATATTISASSTTWAQLKTGGLKIVLDNLVAANTAKSDPSTQATATATGGGASGGSLAAGTYYITYSFCDAFGETLAGGRSAQLTVGATNIPRITLPANPTGVAYKNVYLTAAGGASGTEVLYATGISGTSFDASYAAWSDPGMTAPTANTTGAAGHTELIYSILNPQGSYFQQTIGQIISAYLSGAPMERRDYYRRFSRYEGVLRLWVTALAEIRTLVAANPGTLAWSSTGGVNGRMLRTFS